MIITEFRIILPLTLEEYEIGHLWSFAEASKIETGGGEGVEMITNGPYFENGKAGQYTHNIYHIKSRFPFAIQKLAPMGSLDEIHEKSWNSFPNCKTIVRDSGLNVLASNVLTIHKNDGGETENIHNLPEDEWNNTKVVKIDIANDQILGSDYKAEFDPKLFMSEKCGRGKLSSNWIEELKAKKQNGENPALMCVYKLVKCSFEWYGLQADVESRIEREAHRRLFDFHRQVFCWLDKWYGLKMDEIRKIEEKTKEDLEILRGGDNVRAVRS